jgi:hypothetical protein
MSRTFNLKQQNPAEIHVAFHCSPPNSDAQKKSPEPASPAPGAKSSNLAYLIDRSSSRRLETSSASGAFRIPNLGFGCFSRMIGCGRSTTILGFAVAGADGFEVVGPGCSRVGSCPIVTITVTSSWLARSLRIDCQRQGGTHRRIRDCYWRSSDRLSQFDDVAE